MYLVIIQAGIQDFTVPKNLRKRPTESDINGHRVIRITLIQNCTTYQYFVYFILQVNVNLSHVLKERQ